MDKKDFFVSYNKNDKDWAKWIAGTLEENKYTVYLQAWDISPGDDFISRMSEFLQCSENYIAVLSSAFWESEYCKKEFQTAFNAHLKGNIKKFLPIRIEDVSPDPLYDTTVYIDLFSVGEEKIAEKDLLNAIEHTKNPRKKGTFPNNAINSTKQSVDGKHENRPSFPGSIDSISVEKDEIIRSILLLETNRNKKGDLFNYLVHNVLHSLGFGEAVFDVQRAGREVDMVLKHRIENRYALVESKAQKEKVGGADINKFVGTLDVERGNFEQEGCSVTGYFISQSGFTATALEQERERSLVRKKRNERNELVLLGPTDVVRELIKGNMLCSLSRAVSAVTLPKDETLSLCEEADLIACEYGWIWVLYYSLCPQQSATHFTFVHADGNQLLNSIAESLLAKADKRVYPFSGLTYLSTIHDASLDKQGAKEAYFKYLETELGEIQFEGMPTDKEAGAIKVSLESIFVPLSFNYEVLKQQDNDTGASNKESTIQSASIREVLTKTSRVAILAKPGGGKSTLIRRIALAYADPKRRKKVNDKLPAYDWFPVYIRCRDLGDNATKSILDIIGTIVHRAEIVFHAPAFNSLIEERLQGGHMLLLIDGLDEILVEKYRICFVNQLRTFVATYPNVHLIITSRETGFRTVAGTLTSYCKQYSIAGLDETQIRYLSLKWHEAIMGKSSQTTEESKKVCDIIIGDPRIVALAENPLLLTTLLFVKRWVGYLPTKKCRLYEEMIKLLLVTWNAAAHERLDLDETEPQLAFVAYSMTVQGQQKVTRSQLQQYIIQARKALPEILGYTQVSPYKFIDQVEERSSLLIQLGLEENESGNLEPSYEFSHLSFQEYLTAKAIAEAWVSDPENSSFLSIIKGHMSDDHWFEVIPLTAVLSGRWTKPVIEYLINTCESNPPTKKDTLADIAILHLGNCIASEVPMSKEQLEKSFTQMIWRKRVFEEHQVRIEKKDYLLIENLYIFSTIIKSKYGSTYREFIEVNLFKTLNPIYIFEFCESWIEICHEERGDFNLSTIEHLLNECSCFEDQITGALMMMWNSFARLEYNNEINLHNIFSSLLRLLKSDDVLSCFCAAWCIAWSGYGETNIIPLGLDEDILNRLIKLWVNTDTDTPLGLKRAFSWALYSICSPSLHIQEVDGLSEAIATNISDPKNEFDQCAAIHLTVLRNQWSADEFKSWINENKAQEKQIRVTKSRFLDEMGYFK
ncbi:MAG: TIR domain-containing protein [Lachnospiraceae bacterium]|nr:TIR domain-containing protein [Lachnospiraceae bacterium]